MTRAIDNMNTSELSVRLQIQPSFLSREIWESIAQDEGLDFEVLELSAPPVLNDSRRMHEYADWYRAGGLVRSLHGVFIDVNPASGDAEFRALSRGKYRRSCELALSLGAENIVFHSTCETFLRHDYLDFWAGQSAEFFEELAETYDLNIFVENSQDIDPDPMKELMRRVISPRVGVCLDFGHVNYSHTSPEKWFDALGDRIGYLHLSDNLGRIDDHLPLGSGTVDWKKADRLWRELQKSVPATLEVGGPEGVRKSLEYLRTNGLFGTGSRTDD